MNPLGTWDTFQDLRREQDRARRQRNAAHHSAAAEQARAEGRHDAAQYHEQRARGWRGEPPSGKPVPEPQPGDPPPPEKPVDINKRSAADLRRDMPTTTRTHDGLGRPLDAAGKRFFALRDAGYKGWIGQDGYPVSDEEQAELNRVFKKMRPPFNGDKPARPSTPPVTNAGGATTGAGGGAGVSHASEGNAQLQQAAQNGESAQGAVQQVIDELQQMLQNFLAAAEESQHPEAETVSGQITQAISQAEELQQFIGATKDATEGVKL